MSTTTTGTTATGDPAQAHITISHSYADGTLLDGTTPAEGRKGHPVRAVLDQHNWKWFRSLGMWGQRSSRDQPARRHRIEATAAALRALGQTVAVEIDDTPRDMAQAEQDRAERMQDRAEAIAAKANRRAAASAAHHATARATLDHIPPGQPLLTDHYSYAGDKRRRERAWAHMDKAAALATEADRHTERADTAAKHMRHRYNPITVANRINDLESKLRPGNGTTAYRDKWARDLDHWRAVRAEQIANGEVVHYTPDMLAPGDWVQGGVGSTWYEIARVNKTTVTVKTQRSAIEPDKWLTNKLPLRHITGHHRPNPTP